MPGACRRLPRPCEPWLNRVGNIRQLAAQGFVDPLLFAERMEEALDYYVGDTTFVRHNFEEAKEIVAREGDAPEPP